jgi:hypothetical protein
MKGIWKFASAALVAFAFGCGQEPEKDPYAGMTQDQRLAATAQKLESDPNVSVAAKRVADGAMTRLQSQDELDTFQNGGN